MTKKKNCISDKEKNKYYPKLKWNEKSASIATEKISNQDERENARTQIVRLKILNLSVKRFCRYH